MISSANLSSTSILFLSAIQSGLLLPTLLSERLKMFDAKHLNRCASISASGIFCGYSNIAGLNDLLASLNLYNATLCITVLLAAQINKISGFGQKFEVILVVWGGVCHSFRPPRSKSHLAHETSLPMA
jgi:hypothetical protein